MRILITGGFGFIGGRLAQHLHIAGHHVILGTRKSDGKPDWLPQGEVVQIVWSDGPALEQICAETDVVIHASGMNAQDCIADPVAALECNGLATARLVKAAVSAGVKRFIYISTAHVYGAWLQGVITEESCPRNLHPYATSHLAGEHVVLSSSYRGEIEGVVLRLSNAFGAPVVKDVNCWMLLVNDLCRQAVETGEMVLHTSGRQYRDFIPMSDVCRIVEHVCSCFIDSSSPFIMNAGSGVSTSVLDMARLIQQRYVCLGYKPLITRPADDGQERGDRLIYQSDRLTRSALVLDNDRSHEVDMLLHFCHTFNKK